MEAMKPRSIVARHNHNDARRNRKYLFYRYLVNLLFLAHIYALLRYIGGFPAVYATTADESVSVADPQFTQFQSEQFRDKTSSFFKTASTGVNSRRS